MEEKVEVSKKANAKRGGNGFIAFIAIVALALGGVGAVFSLINYFRADDPITFLGSGTDGNSANFVEGSIASVANKVSSSVVSIVTSTKQRTLFGNYESGAAGTGVIVSGDGYILTNKHVIEGATKINVILDNGTTYENVKLVTTDPLNDIAFLKIDNVNDLPAATLGDSKTINVGQQVIAIGNALGQYQNTVTAGIISGTGRAITASDGSGSNAETLYGMIQTDAAINSGNSGGPLVNAAGEVIGINTATSTTAENMGFAIPISSVKGMLRQLIESGSARRAFVGVYTDADFTVKVSANGPAAKAGVKDGDKIVSINGVKVGQSGSASNIVGEYKPGDTVQLALIRDGKEIAINVTLGGYEK